MSDVPTLESGSAVGRYCERAVDAVVSGVSGDVARFDDALPVGFGSVVGIDGPVDLGIDARREDGHDLRRGPSHGASSVADSCLRNSSGVIPRNSQKLNPGNFRPSRPYGV